jgi:cell division protein FtsZ
VDTSIEGAHGVLINITGGRDMTLHEVSKASQLIHSLAHPEANIIFGTVIDESMKEMVKVTVIATGFDSQPERMAGAEDDPAAGYQRKTPAPFPLFQETPPYVFQPKGSQTLWAPPDWEKQWDPYETPSFIRRNKQTPIRKTSNDIS